MRNSFLRLLLVILVPAISSVEAQERVENPLLVYYPGEGRFPWPLGFLPDGNRVITISGDSGETGRDIYFFHCWDVRDGRRIWNFTYAGDIDIGNIELSPDGSRILFREDYWVEGEARQRVNSVKMIDLTPGFPVKTFFDEEREVLSLTFTPDGRRVLLGVSSTATVEERDVDTGVLLHIHDLTGPEQTGSATDLLAISPDESNLLVGQWGYLGDGMGGSVPITRVDLRDFPSMELRKRIDNSTFFGVHFSPRGSFLVVSPVVGSSFHIYRTNTLERTETVNGYVASGRGFSPSEKYVAVTGRTEDAFREVHLVVADSGESVRVFSDSQSHMCFSPNGTRLLTGGPDHTVLVWDISDLEGVSNVEPWEEY